jgi:flagellar motor switch protein FliN
LSSIEEAGEATRELVSSVLDALTFGFASVCGGEFQWENGQAGVVQNPEDFMPDTQPIVLHFPVELADTKQVYTLTLVLQASLATGVARLVLENDGGREFTRSHLSGPIAPKEQVTYRRAYFQELGDAAAPDESSQLDLLMDVPLEVTVELGRTRRQVREVLELGPGSVIELDKLAGEPVDININGRLIARGEVVVVEENFGVRITDIISPSNRLGPLG